MHEKDQGTTKGYAGSAQKTVYGPPNGRYFSKSNVIAHQRELMEQLALVEAALEVICKPAGQATVEDILVAEAHLRQLGYAV